MGSSQSSSDGEMSAETSPRAQVHFGENSLQHANESDRESECK